MSQRDKPRLALNNITAGVREREDANRTRVAGHRLVRSHCEIRNSNAQSADWCFAMAASDHRFAANARVCSTVLTPPHSLNPLKACFNKATSSFPIWRRLKAALTVIKSPATANAAAA